MLLCYAVEIMNAPAYLIRFDGGKVMCPRKGNTLPQWLEERSHDPGSAHETSLVTGRKCTRKLTACLPV